MRHVTCQFDGFRRSPSARLSAFFPLEDEGDRLLSGLSTLIVMIPLGFALEVFAGVNRGIVLAVGDVAVEKGLGGAFIH